MSFPSFLLLPLVLPLHILLPFSILSSNSRLFILFNMLSNHICVPGKGTFGRVRLAKHRLLEGRPLALKILKKTEVIRLKQVEHIRSEKELLGVLYHPFIVTMFAFFQDVRHLYMVLEYIPGGEIFSHLRSAGRFGNDTTIFYSSEILLALQYMHGRDIVYRDLKPENLLLDNDGHIKITDFGFAKIVQDRTWTLCGTPEYLAPEIIQSKGHAKPADWWAFGVLCFEMLAGYPPFYDENPFGIYQKILGGRVDFPRHFCVSAKEMIKSLLRADRTKRLGCTKSGAEEIKRHKWMKKVHWGKCFQKKMVPPIKPDVKDPFDTSFFDKYPDSDPLAEHKALSPEESKKIFGEVRGHCERRQKKR